ncbi:MAG: DinB family protein [Ginsengibacter sp.]
MTSIEKQILETWFINHRTNLKVLDNLTEEALTLSTSKRGGGSVGHQLAHMYNVRFWKLEKINQELVKELTTVKAEDSKTIAMLKDCHTVSAGLIAEVLKKGIEDGGNIKGNKRGLVPLLGYFIHHEAHHRGNILLTLKLCGYKLTDELKYGIWEWNKL